MKSTKTTVQAVLTSLALGLALLVAGPAQANTAPTSSDSLSHLALAHHTMVDGWMTLHTIASQQQASIDHLVALMEEEKQAVEEEVVVVQETQIAETTLLVATPAAEAPAPVTPVASVPYDSSHLSPEELEAKEFIAQKESGGSYTARNGIFYGRYQLTESYLNGDLSPENQERVVDAYVAERYGSWVAAKAFWLENHWY